ncbi:rhodanese-like domain-containing protein [Sporolactobacillus kofuensis]|uniref:Rhodanese-like domain-containing protein n=1 Tax=Sporolactobacillus kofuensis TaxID=269672 RepID=A0ABW1WFA4_9BACL|nr:rhodanese-like domain-containing protein [Sporolactobacillus kofuensis]MCO7176538.1 rhodanese-like domain-containing protein [Sporolactobacillus kofuensis]
MFEEILPQEVESLRLQGKVASIIDVREADEYESGHIPGAVNISVNHIEEKLNLIDKDKEYILVCHSGGRSSYASEVMADHGFKVKNMTGGMLAWTGEVDY